MKEMANCFLRLSLVCGIVGFTLNFGIIDAIAIRCGTTDFTRKLISRGTGTERGEFPFLAALYLVQQLQFICGGSLISAKHVLTAAHCTKDYGIAFLPDDVNVFLGAYDLTSRNESGVVQRDISEICVHPDWKEYSGKYDADIAILVLSEIVAFTNYVRIVCMPPDDTVVANSNGTIVGWGLTENGTQSHLQYPKQGVTTALNDSYCYTTDYVVALISSLRTFCGSGAVSSPNKGDSGGGFFVRYGSAWVQYGIVSAIRSNATGFVDPNSIAVYTSVKEFKTWINDTVMQSGGEVSELVETMDKIPIQLNCEYDIGDKSNSYGCFAYNLDVRSGNMEVASLTGYHFNGKTSEDVDLLQLRNGTMFYIPDGIGKVFKNLTKLEIFNGLNTKLMKRSNFKSLESLELLVILKNDIETLEEDTLWDLAQLEFFIFIDNKLSEIREKTFVSNVKLREVFLHTNQLNFVPGSLFGNNLMLELVRLDGNKLKTIDEVTFVNNSKLRGIYLESNQLQFIPRNVFQNNFQLERIRLDGNNLETIDEVSFVNSSKLREVYLFSNKLEFIPVNLFQNNLLLEIVHLSDNNLKTIDELTFVNNSKLKEVYLNANQLETLPENLFQNSLLLEYVSFSNNSIKVIAIDFTVFKNIQRISFYTSLCIDGYWDGSDDPVVYRNEFRNLTEFQDIIKANCSSVKP